VCLVLFCVVFCLDIYFLALKFVYLFRKPGLIWHQPHEMSEVQFWQSVNLAHSSIYEVFTVAMKNKNQTNKHKQNNKNKEFNEKT
jgi:hypothetical protein